LITRHAKKLIATNKIYLRRKSFSTGIIFKQFLPALIIIFFGISVQNACADTPVTLYRSFAGNINVTGAGGTLRTANDATNACSVTTSGSLTLSGIPATGTSSIVAAYLYWAGSGGDPRGGNAADYTVNFNGTSVTADRQYTASFNGGGTNVFYFFEGVKDVTSQITGNGTYTFSNLTVQNANVTGGGQYCANSTVLSAFALVVIYSNSNETLHVVNLWEGFQSYYGSAITLTPTNFIVPTPAPSTTLSARHLVVTWEGDSGNSGTNGGYSENLTFCAPSPCTGTALSSAPYTNPTYNPVNNQFNSSIYIPPSGPYATANTSWGLDLDLYDITSLLHAGNASAQAVYSSGADLVILGNQTMSIPNVYVADMAIAMTNSGNFSVGANGTFTLTVTNNGPSSTSGTITVTDTLPAGLTYVGYTGTGWSCSNSGQTVTCTRTDILASGSSEPDITITVRATSAGSLTNTASVSSGAFDNVSSNNSASNTVTVGSTTVTVVKSADKANASPGDTITYTMTIANTGTASATSVRAVDAVPAYTTYVANSTRLNNITVYGDGTTSPLISGLLIDNNASRTAGAAATGTMPAGTSATVRYQVTVN
jgi:MSHA biogenesis protein MshQ